MATLSPPPKLQFLDQNGAPLVGGKLWTYAAGTTTLLTTYVDSAGVTPNTNPIILDERGEADVWLGSSLYKFRLTTSADVDVFTVDNIGASATLASLSGSGGSALVGFIQSGASAVAQTVQYRLREDIYLTDFLATDWDSSTVTNTAWAAALAECVAQGKALYVPGSTNYYRVTAAITVPSGVHIHGDGYNSVVRQVTVDQNLFVCAGQNEFSGLHLQGCNLDTVTDPDGNCGIYALNVDNISVHNNWFSRFYASATHFQGCYNIRVQENVFFQNNWPQNPTYEPSFRACADISFSSIYASAQTGGRLIATGNYHFGQMSAAIFFNGAAGDQGAIIANNYIQPLDASGDPILTGMNNRHGIAVNYGSDAATRDTLVSVQNNIIRYVRWAGIYCQTADGQNTGAVVIDSNVIDHTGISDTETLGGGIRVATGTGAPIIISNNSITEHQSTVTGGITIQSTYASPAGGRVTVQGNAITRCLGFGVDLVQICVNVDIFDNQIIDCGLNDIIFEQNATVQADAYRIRIMRNRIYRTNAATYSLWIYGGVVNAYTVVIQDNWIVGNSKTTPTTAVNSAIYFASTNSMGFFQVKGNHIEKFYRAITAGGYFPAGRHFNNLVIDGNDFLDCSIGVDFSAIANTATILVTNSTWNGVTNNFGTALLSGYPCLYEGVRNGALMNVNAAAAPTTGTWIDGDAWTHTAPATGSPPGGVCTTPGATGVFVFTNLANL